MLFSLAVAGCTLTPSISVLGSYFPDWLFCSVGALVLTLAVRGLLVQRGLERLLTPAPLVLPVLMLLFALLAWLIFF